MKQETLKALLIRDKLFLKDLFEGPNPLKNNRILINATDSQLNTLLLYLHFLSTGQIKINKTNFEQLEKLKKITILKAKVEKKATLLILLNGPRADKIMFLKKLSTVMPNLLYGLFNLI